jgi:hypothetical protein
MGHPRVELTLTSSVPVAFVSAKLCDVAPDGTSALVTRGILNLTHRGSHERPEALPVGEPVRATIELDATAYVFEPGHRIRLSLAPSDFPSSWPPPAAGTLSVDLAASTLVLPTLVGPPVAAPPVFASGAAEGKGVERVRWEVHEEVLRRERAVEIDHGGVRGRVGPTETSDRYHGEIRVRWDRPGHCTATAGAELELAWPEATVRSSSRLVLRSDPDAWHLTIELDVDDGDERIAERRWERTIPRHLQ